MRLLPLLAVLVVGAALDPTPDAAAAPDQIKDAAAAEALLLEKLRLDPKNKDLSDSELKAQAKVVTAVTGLPLLWRTFPEEDASAIVQPPHVVKLSEGGKVATAISGNQKSYAHVTTGDELTEGRHYWEVELLSDCHGMLVGITRPNLEPAGNYFDASDNVGWFISLNYGALYGNGKDPGRDPGDDEAGPYDQGDRVGVLLDLNTGSLLFFKNGVQHGLGYLAGSVKGPVVAAVEFGTTGNMVRLHADVAFPTISNPWTLAKGPIHSTRGLPPAHIDEHGNEFFQDADAEAAASAEFIREADEASAAAASAAATAEADDLDEL
jgi:hypothetical protein